MAASSPELDAAADLIAAKDNVVVMVGAGISVSAGIPDFRSPGTGLYDNLQEYGLPRPEAIFDMDFFLQNPKPFYRLCKELWPGSFQPTPTHHLLRLLHQKGKLLRCYTQNIDSLETAAGLPPDALVAAHGNFDSARVVGGPEVPTDRVKAAAMDGIAGWERLNAECGGLVKPSIVFFGEPLPPRFFLLLQQDFPRCELLLVMGTSLVVTPFASLVAHVPPGTPRVLINRERVGEIPMRPFGMAGPLDFTSADSKDVLCLGDCDDAARHIVRRLGWESEFEALCSAGDAGADVMTSN